MRMMDELKHLFLYSANKKVYVPIDEKDKRKNSAILLLTPDLETSGSLMNLPYIYNPGLFNSFYIDRNVSAYIDNMGIENIEFDEQEEEALSEAMIHSSGNIKFKFDDHTSIMDEQYIRDVFNKNVVKYYTSVLKINKIPDKINVVVHPTVSDLQKDAPKYIKNTGNDYYSYFDKDTIHLVSKIVYNPQSMRGPYEMYLKIELLYALMVSYNKNLAFIPTMGIAYSIAELEKYMKSEKNNIISKSEAINFAHTISIIINKHGYDIIHKYIKTADINVFATFTLNNAIKALNKIVFESDLSYFERQRLLPSDFGIPDKRKYPIHDEDHVRAAIRMFNNCDPDDEEELAKAIIKKMNKFGITDVKVGAANRFKKYYKNTIKESSDMELECNWEQIESICSHLSKDELRRITFHDTYRDSKFVIKRLIGRVDLQPAGFIDVYQFPSNPKIAQIVIAVDERYRGMGVAKYLVNELMKSNLHEIYNFDMYYWTAHTDNIASQALALKNGFADTGEIDKYGRKVFINKIKESNSIKKEIPFAHNEAGFVSTESSFITENMALFFEADDPKYSQKLRRYLYSERIKNNKEVLVLYDEVKARTPNAKKTYLKIKMYKKLNVFIDLSYYHALFLKNNTYKLDNAVKFYFDFLNRLINNREIDSEYSKKTIFIPVDNNVWPVVPGSDIYDFKKNLNPISIIFRLIRTNPAILKTAWGNKDIVFVGSRGYFTIDFNKFDLKDLTRLKINLRKLMSSNEPIKDDYEVDDITDDTANSDHPGRKYSDTPKAMAAKMIDRVENSTSIRIDNMEAINNKHSSITGDMVQSPHLRIVPGNLNINRKSIGKENGIVIISIDPDGPDGFTRLSKTQLSGVSNSIDTYCMP